MQLPLVTPELGQLIKCLAAGVTLEANLFVYALLVPLDAVRLWEVLATYVALVLIQSNKAVPSRPLTKVLVDQADQLKYNDKQRVMQQQQQQQQQHRQQ